MARLRLGSGVEEARGAGGGVVRGISHDGEAHTGFGGAGDGCGRAGAERGRQHPTMAGASVLARPSALLNLYAGVSARSGGDEEREGHGDGDRHRLILLHGCRAPDLGDTASLSLPFSASRFGR
ncbi:unnamed protein product [Urochloa humidicola]